MPSPSRPAAHVRFRPNVQVIARGDDLYLAGDDTFVVTAPPAEVASVLRGLAQPPGLTLAALEARLGALAAQMLSALDRAGLLQRSALAFRPVARSLGAPAYFDAVFDDPGRVSPLARKGVLVVGVGAIGGEVARHLAAAGLGTLALVDHDVVELANLNRQYLFTVADAGRRKTVAARAALGALAPATRVEIFDRRVAEAADLARLPLPPLDAVVCCADTPPRRIGCLVSEFAEAAGLIFAMATVGLGEGCVGPIVRPGGRPFHAWARSLAEEPLCDGLSTGIPSFGPTNSLIAAQLAHDLLHVLAGGDAASVDHLVRVRFSPLRSERVPLTPAGSQASAAARAAEVEEAGTAAPC